MQKISIGSSQTQLNSQNREHLTNIVITGLLSLICLACCLPEIKMWRNTNLFSFPRSHLERDQAAVGHRSKGVRQRHVERGGLRHQRPLPCHNRSEAESILWRKLTSQSRLSRPTNQCSIIYIYCDIQRCGKVRKHGQPTKDYLMLEAITKKLSGFLSLWRLESMWCGEQ